MCINLVKWGTLHHAFPTICSAFPTYKGITSKKVTPKPVALRVEYAISIALSIEVIKVDVKKMTVGYPHVKKVTQP